MIEESPEAFIAEWGEHAVNATIFPRAEGVPLIEAEVNGVILQLFERTGPYEALPGERRLIIHALTEELTVESEAEEVGTTVTGLSAVQVVGRVTLINERVLAVDAGFPIVVGLLGASPALPAVGETVRFENRPPLHGFIVTSNRAVLLRTG